MNVITVAGRVSKDAEQRYTPSGAAVLGFNVATDVGYGDKKHALFFNCSLWGKRGESLEPYLKKGTAVTVSGEFDKREYESNGKTGTSLEINVNDVALQGSRSQSSDNRSESDNGFRQPTPQTDTDFKDSSIPF